MTGRRYRIERYLTEGGMGAIYIGKKLGPGGFEKEVVLKQLLPEYTSRPEFRDLFFREAKISATLDHANIVHTFDLVESDESLFIVMEYVRGADLRTIVRRARQRRRELSPAAVLHVILEVLAGLAYAHTRKDPNGQSLDIIHRDVSPSNILCSAQGEVKLSDFGIAKASTHSSVFYRVRGKVGYMSPEQARNETIDHRSDLYSIAVCLYEALTGERLFVGDLSTPPDEIYSQPIPRVSEKRPSLPPSLDDVLSKAFAARVDDRYQDALAFSEALRRVTHEHGLAFSAPELAAHLSEILGPDPERWLRDEGAGAASSETQKIPRPPTAALEGKEAASLGVVDDAEEDVPTRSVLSAKGVSDPKDDAEVDSLLSDRDPTVRADQRKTPTWTWTQAGLAHGQPQSWPQNSVRDPASKANAPSARPTPSPRSEPGQGTPPPVWTSAVGPTTPQPAAKRAQSSGISTPSPVPAPPVPGRPPAFAPQAVASGSGSGRFAVPPPPPSKFPPPPTLADIPTPAPAEPIDEEAWSETPPPSAGPSYQAASPAPQAYGGDAYGAGAMDPYAQAPYAQQAPYAEQAPYAQHAPYGGGPPGAAPPGHSPHALASTQAGGWSAGASRLPPPTASYDPFAPPAPLPASVSGALDGGFGAATVVTKKGGPPFWFSLFALVAGLGGGGALAHKVTAPQLAALELAAAGRGEGRPPRAETAAEPSAAESPRAASAGPEGEGDKGDHRPAEATGTGAGTPAARPPAEEPGRAEAGGAPAAATDSKKPPRPVAAAAPAGGKRTSKAAPKRKAAKPPKSAGKGSKKGSAGRH